MRLIDVSWKAGFLLVVLNVYMGTAVVRKKRAVFDSSAKKWPGGIIPYYIDTSAFNSEELFLLYDALDTWNSETCVRFRPKLDGDKNWAKITGGTKCYSSVGMVGSGEQIVNLASPHCRFYGTYLHELGHTIGLHHEHIRPTRDEHLEINERNIQHGNSHYFNKINHSDIVDHGLPYDVQSIMHYGSQSFSNTEDEPTINVKIKSKSYLLDEIYNKDISYFDAKIVNLHYGCAKLCTMRTNCSGRGYVDEFCECHTTQTFESRRCRDKLETEWCLSKQKLGHCDLKPAYMSVNCRKSCDRCYQSKTKFLKKPQICTNFENDKKCDNWAKRGECNVNPGFMKKQCKKSCGLCVDNEITKDGNEACKNVYEDLRCDNLKKRHECSKNQKSMGINCAKSCGMCSQKITENKIKSISKCQNQNGDDFFCEAWTKTGECKKNPGYMLTMCAKACGVCKDSGHQPNVIVYNTTNICQDKLNDCVSRRNTGDCIRYPKTMLSDCGKTCGNCKKSLNDTSTACMNLEKEINCEKWSMQGKCQTKRLFMSINCANTCKLCDRKNVDKGCRNLDIDSDCEAWTRKGDCSRKEEFMMIQCGKSCGRCNTSSYTECIDKYDTSLCGLWKDVGLCFTNRSFMIEHCAQSCGSCDITNGKKPKYCTNTLEDKFCELWKNQGECKTNQEFMLKQCRKSCGICENYHEVSNFERQCRNIYKDEVCYKLKVKGYCLKRPGIMNIKCSKTCNSCTIKTTDTSLDDTCQNFYSDAICEKWKSMDKCKSHRVFMKQMCMRSCDFCKEDLLQVCQNLLDDEQCEQLSKENQCQTNPDYMLLMCGKICNNCSVVSRFIPSKENCMNLGTKLECHLWSEAGECMKNPKFMLKHCVKACEVCLKIYRPYWCRDKTSETKCQSMADQGECINSREFMKYACEKTCDMCPGIKMPPTLEMDSCKNRFSDMMCGALRDMGKCTIMFDNCQKSCKRCPKITKKHNTTSICFNLLQDNLCNEWEIMGDCRKYPSLMLSQCRKSCGRCTKSLECQNVYDDIVCETWAREGKCVKNMKFMTMMCLKSCGRCSLLSWNISDTNKSESNDCENKYGTLSCDAWKEIGECDKNSEFMIDNCAKSCGFCNKSTTEIKSMTTKNSCKNLYSDKLCDYWVKSKLCTNHRSFISISCSKSCNYCHTIKTKKMKVTKVINLAGNLKCIELEKAGECKRDLVAMRIKCALSCRQNQHKFKSSTAASIPTVEKFDICINIAGDLQCSYWARQGQCNTSLFVQSFCRKACDKCHGGMRKPNSCADKYSAIKCRLWSKRGDCNRNKIWMSEFCANSCQICKMGLSKKAKESCRDKLNCFGEDLIK